MMDRDSLRYRGMYTKVPGDPSRWRKWEAMGRVLVKDARRQGGGRLPDRLTSSGGESEFPRLFQILEEGGTIGFSGSMAGFHMTFLGKGAALRPERMLKRAAFGRGETALIHYGCEREKVDRVGLEILEAVHRAGGWIVAATRTEEQRRYLEERYSGMLAGIVSLEGIMAEEGDAFDWPPAMPWLPDPERHWKECQETLSLYEQRTVMPFARAVGRFLPAGEEGFDLVFERSGQDTLGVSTSVARARTGRVVYAEAMAGRRYSFYAPQVWMGERRVLMPAAAIDGTVRSEAPGADTGRRREVPAVSEGSFFRIRRTG